jgi:exodeoxyribonuclease VII large subunit
MAKILLYPSLVQGSEAPESLCRGLEYLNADRACDVIIIGRGGGSIEDLWAFNDERVARAIATSDIPVISAVGHETDFTICDFACSLRAPTPSGAAELAVPDERSVRSQLDGALGDIKCELTKKLSLLRARLEYSENRRVIQSPYGFIDEKRQRLDLVSDRLSSKYSIGLAAKKEAYGRLCEKLDALSPLSVLTRGYGAVYSENGNVLTSARDVNKGERISVRLKDGTVEAIADAVTVNDNKGASDNGR